MKKTPKDNPPTTVFNTDKDRDLLTLKIQKDQVVVTQVRMFS